MYNVLKYSIAINDEIKTKSQFTATATEPPPNRKFPQFNNDQYCTFYGASSISKSPAKVINGLQFPPLATRVYENVPVTLLKEKPPELSSQRT